MTAWGVGVLRGGYQAARAGSWRSRSGRKLTKAPPRGPALSIKSGSRSCGKARRLTGGVPLPISFPGMHRNTPEKVSSVEQRCGKNNGHSSGSSVGLSLPGGTCTASSWTLNPSLRESSSESGSWVCSLPLVICTGMGVSPKGPVLGSLEGNRLAHLATPIVLCSQFKRPCRPLCRALRSCPQLRLAPQPCPSSALFR